MTYGLIRGTTKAILQFLLRHFSRYLGHWPLHWYFSTYTVLGSSISFAQRLNDFSILISSSYVDNLYVHLNIPFATALALLATVQLGSSLAILSFNRNRAAATMLHYASLAGLVASFAASSLVTTTAIEYTLNIGQWPKVSTLYPGA